MPPNPERGLRDRLIQAAVVIGLTASAIAVKSCADSIPPPPPPDPLACDNSDLHIGFRGSDSRENYGTLETDDFSGKPVKDVMVRFFPGTSEGTAVASIEAANPNLKVSKSDDKLPKNALIRLNISSFDEETLPQGETIESFGKSQGFDKDSMECLTGFGGAARFDKDVSIRLPRQSNTADTFKEIVIKGPGDTYYSIAKANGVDVSSVTPENAASQNLVPPSKLQKGDTLYVKNSGSPEFADPNNVLKNFVNQYGVEADKVQKDYGVPREVTLAQAILESGYGSSELATQANNFFGMKANDEWHGDTYEAVTTEHVTKEQLKDYVIISQKDIDDGKFEITTKQKFKKFPDVQASFTEYGNYLKTRNGGKQYQDAFETKDPIEFAERLAKAGYATGNGYASKVTTLIKKVQAAEIPTAQEESRVGEEDLKKIYDSYKPNQRIFWKGNREHPNDCYIGPQNVEDDNLSDLEMFKLAYANIQGANPTKESYEAFKSSIIDQRAEAKAINSNFDQANNPKLGKPGEIKRDVKHFVIHFTANKGEGADDFDGETQAKSMKQADSAGINYFINRTPDGKSQTYYLSDTFVYHAISEHGKAFGVEIAGCDIAKLSPAQIGNAIELSAYFLIENGYLAEDLSSGSAVDAVIVGHGELYGHKNTKTGKADDHSDWMPIVMDPFRDKLKKLLTDLGYKP